MLLYKDYKPKNVSKHNKRKLLIWGFIGMILIIIISIIYAFIIIQYYDSPNDRGSFGEMFGALNTLFSGLAFLGIIFAIMLQHSELEQQINEMRLSSIAQADSFKVLSDQLNNMKIQNMIEATNYLLESIERKINIAKAFSSEESKLKYEDLCKVRDYWEDYLQKLVDLMKKDIIFENAETYYDEK